MSAFVILLDGEVRATPRLLAKVSGRRAIAADGGIRHAAALGLRPELWLGDFDSMPDGSADLYRDVPRIAFPADKDRTDGELAVEAARERGASDLLLAGAFGGPRADHALLHAMHAIRLAGEGLAVTLSDGNQEGHPILAGRHGFDLPEGALFSILGFSELAGLTVTGARWPLSGRRVPFGSSLTLSNVVAGRLEIELAAGRALLVATTAA
jgi:thiamine pyrophosphokinase